LYQLLKSSNPFIGRFAVVHQRAMKTAETKPSPTYDALLGAEVATRTMMATAEQGGESGPVAGGI